MIEEFKAFISKGNVIDLAVAVVIGGAFGRIVTSLVNDIIMPIIGIILGGTNFRTLTIELNNVVIHYGLFMQNIVNFLIISLAIFLALKYVLKKDTTIKKPKKADDIILLEEIKDLLKKQK